MEEKALKLETEIITIIEEEFGFDDPFPIKDWLITTDDNTPITHITKGSSDNNAEIGLWCGNPMEDKHAEEIIVSEEERASIYKEILDYM